MKIKVNHNTLQEKLQYTKDKQEKSLQNISREKFPVGISKLVIIKAEHSRFDTSNQLGVNKIRLHFNYADSKKQQQYYNFSFDFNFFKGKNKETGEAICVGFEQLYTFIFNAFGKHVPFHSEEIELDDAAQALSDALNVFIRQNVPFYAIVIHREKVYKERVILVPEIFLASVQTVSEDLNTLHRIDIGMNNKVWRISENERARLLAKKRNHLTKTGKQEAGVPKGVDSYTPDLNNIPSNEDDDLPF